MIRETRPCASRDITQAVGSQAMRAAHRCQAPDSLLHEYAGRTAERADEATYLRGAPPGLFLQTPRRRDAAVILRIDSGVRKESCNAAQSSIDRYPSRPGLMLPGVPRDRPGFR